MSTVYLIHFDPPYKHARHYMGWTDNGVEQRLAEHRAGRGARLTQVAAAAGCELILVRTWSNTERAHERVLKNRKNAPRMCPLCNPHWSARGTFKTKG